MFNTRLFQPWITQHDRSRLALSLIGAFALTGPAAADDSDWIGLYKGLDALDGSVDYLSIAPTGPGTFDIRIVPSVISLCENGRGWIVADGTLTEDNTLRRHNSRVICEGREPVDIDDRIFTRDAQTGLIRFGATDDGRPLFYHRISTN